MLAWSLTKEYHLFFFEHVLNALLNPLCIVAYNEVDFLAITGCKGWIYIKPMVYKTRLFDVRIQWKRGKRLAIFPSIFLLILYLTDKFYEDPIERERRVARFEKRWSELGVITFGSDWIALFQLKITSLGIDRSAAHSNMEPQDCIGLENSTDMFLTIRAKTVYLKLPFLEQRTNEWPLGKRSIESAQ